MLSQRCNVLLVSNTDGLLSSENACFLPEPTQNISIQNFPWKKDFPNSHTGLRTAPLRSLYVCWALTWCGASCFLLGKTGSTWFPGFAEFTGKTCQPGSRIWESHGALSILQQAETRLKGNYQAASPLEQIPQEGSGLVGGSGRWDPWFCLADCALTLLFSHLVIQWDDSCKWIAAKLKSEKSSGTIKGHRTWGEGGENVFA